MIKLIYISSFLFLVSSCTNYIEKDKVQRVPPSIGMQKCEDLTQLNDNTFKAVILKLNEVVGLYKECENKRESLQKFIEKDEV